jgi:hypothetical protein
MPGRRTGTLLSLVALTLTGCMDSPALSTPGARAVVFQVWGQPGEPPMVVHAEKLEQLPDPVTQKVGFDHLRFEQMRVRRPFSDGVVCLDSPNGEFHKKSAEAMLLNGPVHISGVLHEEPLVGVAARAVVHEDGTIELFGEGSAPPGPGIGPEERRLVEVALIYHGSVMRSWRFRISGLKTNASERTVMDIDSRPYPFTTAAESPAVAAGLAALPRPLALPELEPMGPPSPQP